MMAWSTKSTKNSYPGLQTSPLWGGHLSLFKDFGLANLASCEWITQENEVCHSIYTTTFLSICTCTRSQLGFIDAILLCLYIYPGFSKRHMLLASLWYSQAKPMRSLLQPDTNTLYREGLAVIYSSPLNLWLARCMWKLLVCLVFTRSSSFLYICRDRSVYPGWCDGVSFSFVGCVSWLACACSCCRHQAV